MQPLHLSADNGIHWWQSLETIQMVIPINLKQKIIAYVADGLAKRLQASVRSCTIIYCGNLTLKGEDIKLSMKSISNRIFIRCDDNTWRWIVFMYNIYSCVLDNFATWQSLLNFLNSMLAIFYLFCHLKIKETI